MTHITAEQTQAVHDLMMSETMQRLCGLAAGFGMDPTDPANIKTMLTTTVLDVIRGLDQGRIHFDDEHDRIMLHGLLAVAMEVIYDGKFAAGLARTSSRMQ